MAQPFKSPTGIYQLRRKVPSELRRALGHEYKRSLDLVERGFLDYAQSAPLGGQLFPKLKPSPVGFYGANFGKRWAAYLREVVGLTTSVSPSHGFRHTFKTLCREVGIPEDVHDAITGHMGAGAVARDYGRMPLKRMADEIRKYPLVAAESVPSAV